MCGVLRVVDRWLLTVSLPLGTHQPVFVLLAYILCVYVVHTNVLCIQITYASFSVSHMCAP